MHFAFLMRRLLFLLALLTGSIKAQSWSYTPTACVNGTTTVNHMVVGRVCNEAYSTNGPNAATRITNVYFNNTLGSSNASGPAVIFLHGGGWTGTAQNTFNWLSTSANPVGQSAFVAAGNWSLYEPDYVSTTGTTATQAPAQQQDIDCLLRSIKHNQGTAGWPGNGHFIVWGESAGAHLALLCGQICPMANPNCEYTDTYVIDEVIANSPIVDLQAAAVDTSKANAATVLGYIELYVPCATLSACGSSVGAGTLSPTNGVASGQPRVLFLAGQGDTWLTQTAQTATMFAKYAAGTATFVFPSTCGHLLDDQGPEGCGSGGVNGFAQQTTIAFIRNNTLPTHAAGSSSRAGGTW